MAKFTISNEVREAVILRAFKCCEYCKSQDKYSPTSFTIDHIIPESLDGTSELANLAYACFLCNRLKSNKLKAFDILTGKWIPLFNPRKDIWRDHFAWNEDTTKIIGITPIGRCTVKELTLNREKLIEYRECIIPFGAHPPEN
jgi:hypothetical protein